MSLPGKDFLRKNVDFQRCKFNDHPKGFFFVIYKYGIKNAIYWENRHYQKCKFEHLQNNFILYYYNFNITTYYYNNFILYSSWHSCCSTEVVWCTLKATVASAKPRTMSMLHEWIGLNLCPDYLGDSWVML